MQLTLTKLPWYAQVGAFVALAAVGCGLFVYYYEMPVHADMATREARGAAHAPRDIELVDAIPRTALGKVRRRDL
jgi:acyl-coenzyme A synthetase/AMP-(fatty) acid ligase